MSFSDLTYSKGFVIIPKSVSKKRIISNAEIFDFGLTALEMKEVRLVSSTPPVYHRALAFPPPPSVDCSRVRAVELTKNEVGQS